MIFQLLSVILYEQKSNGSLQKRLIEDVQKIYLNNDLVTPLALHQLDTLGFAYQTFRLVFTPSLITNIYGSRVTNQMLTDAKYIQADGTNWWISSGRNIYIQGAETIATAQQRFYLPVAVHDVFDIETKLSYDDYHLIIIETEDAMQNRTSVQTLDYRTVGPTVLRDANDNISEVVLDELAMVIVTSVHGEESDGNHGDEPLANYTIIVPTDIAQVIADPINFLQHATTFFYYDLFAWMNNNQPVCFASVVRETHESELSNGDLTKVFLSVGYSNGLGKSLQTKMQTEPGEALKWQGNALVTVDTSPNLRWVGNGRTILNNKGNPVKQYEPFFSTTFEYENDDALVEIGFSSVFYYDALGRTIRVEHANGTFSRTEFDAWKQLGFDENDTVLESTWYSDRGSPNPVGAEPSDPEQRAAWLAAKHANTPSQQHFDSLGRAVYTIADNGAGGTYATQTILDIENNRREIIDARNNSVMKYDYDMLSHQVHQISMDAGERFSFNDALNKQVYAWDNLKHRFKTTYDDLHRPLQQLLKEDVNNNDPERIIQFSIYGENQLNDKQLNLRTRVYQSYDQSGMSASAEYDFKGNVKYTSKQLAIEYKKLIDWNVANPLSLLHTETFSGAAFFDALSRVTELQLPDASKRHPGYNETKMLAKVDAFIPSRQQNISFVKNINYNAKGERENILYGNNTATKYEYDQKTYHLTRLLTTRNNGADIMQDLNYTFDPVSNITGVKDNAQQAIFFNNASIDPSNKFEYDAVYRLIYAQGREHAGSNNAGDQFDGDKTSFNNQRLTLPGDMNAMQRYEEKYLYDEVGNMLQMIHNAGNGAFSNKWTKLLSYNNTDNKLTQLQVSANTTDYFYDAHGNMQNLQNGSFNMNWNYADQLKQVDLGGGGIAYYVYDGNGQRVRKIIESGNLIKERIYLSNYEVYRETQNGQPNFERETIHVMDDKQRIALIETRTKGQDNGLEFLIRYQYANHLETAALELDEKAAIISYEEYYPFGSTAYQAMRNQTETSKRYRYTGKERDEESGLYYHGARYYACWLARWTAADPVGIKDGVNDFVYVQNNPVRLHDPSGLQGNDKTVQITKSKTTDPQPRFPSKGVPSPHDDGLQRALPPKGQGAEVSADIAIPDVKLAGRTKLGLVIGRTLLGDSTRRRLDFSGDFKVTPQIDALKSLPSFLPFHPAIRGDISGSGSTVSSAVGTTLPDADAAVAGFTGQLRLTGELEGVPLVSGKFSLLENITGGDTATSLSFHAHLDVGIGPVAFPHAVNLNGTGTATADDLNLHGSLFAYGPGVAVGNWDFGRKSGFEVNAHYVGLQFGPIGLGSLDPRDPVPTSPDDPPPILPHDQAAGSLSRYATVDTFSPGTSVGYTYLHANVSKKSYVGVSAGFAWKASVSHNDMSRPSVFVFDLPGVGDALKSALKYNPSSREDTPAGVYVGANLFGTF